MNKKFVVRLTEEECSQLRTLVRAGKAAARKLTHTRVELRVLSGQCLERRIPDQAELEREGEAWEQDRNQRTSSVDWRFTTADARIKLNVGSWRCSRS